MSAPRRPLDEDDRDWWGDGSREQRSRPLVVLGVVLLAGVAFGAWTYLRKPAADSIAIVDASAP